MIPTSHIHPMLVHFPIALVTFGFVAEVAFLFMKKQVCLPKIGTYLLFTGTLSSIVVLLSGFLFTTEMSGSAGEIMETHELFAVITVISLVIASIFRIFILLKKSENANLQWVGLAMYAIATISVSITGFYGGNLVYSYMMPL